jgi:hypothetical protein
MIASLPLSVLVLLAVPPPEAQAPNPSAGANIAITLTVGRTGGSGGPSEKVYRMMGRDDSMSRLLMGWRMPIPTRVTGEGAEATPAVNVVYQNVGVSADLRTDLVKAGVVRLRGEVEVSGLRETQATGAMGAGGKAPLIGTFQQSLDVVLKEGKKQRVAEVPDPESGTLYLDLEVDILE